MLDIARGVLNIWTAAAVRDAGYKDDGGCGYKDDVTARVLRVTGTALRERSRQQTVGYRQQAADSRR